MQIETNGTYSQDIASVKTNCDMVREFHECFNVEHQRNFDNKLSGLRVNLIDEEVEELWTAIQERDRKAIAKELADILYVVYGTAIAFEIPINEVFAEVHRSNMSKLGYDGKPVYREDGKVLKGPNYQPADLSFVGDMT